MSLEHLLLSWYPFQRFEGFSPETQVRNPDLAVSYVPRVFTREGLQARDEVERLQRDLEADTQRSLSVKFTTGQNLGLLNFGCE